MKSKATLNRRKNKRRKRNKPSSAAERAAELMEQRTLDSLDPVKNAANNKLFIFDSDLPHTNGAGDNKAIKNKTTWAENKLAHRGLGVVLPKTTQKSDKEKRKLPTIEKDTIEQKAKRIKTEEDKKMDVDEKNVLLKTVKEPATKKSYDLWANVPEPPKNPKQSFIEEVLHPKQKEFVHKPIQSKLAAVVPNAGQSYRPVEEDQNELKQKNKKVEEHLHAAAIERKVVLQKLSSYKHYFPRIDNRVHKDEYEEGEEPEQIRAIPEKHKTAKEAKKIQERKKRKELEAREEEFNRTQRDIYRIDDILAGIEEEEKAKEQRSSKRQANKDLRFNQPFSTDGKKIKQPLITPVAQAPQRLRTLTTSNPVHDQIVSLKNRGLMSSIKPKTKHEKHFRLVEPRDVMEMMREDEEKYLKPVLEKLKQ